MKPDRSWEALVNPGSATDFFQFSKHPVFTVTADYTVANAAICSELARIVYKEDARERHLLLGCYGLRELAFFDHKGTQAMLVYAQKWDAAFLACRGSSEFLDWVANLSMRREVWGARMYVHGGFKDALERVWSEVDNALGRLDCAVFVTGHSLGGALTVLACGLRSFTAAYTFGAPPVGNPEFVSTLDGQNIYRVTHGRDFVPDQLPTLKHAGELVELKEISFGWSLRNPPPRMRCHIPQLYSCALERLL